jgi:2-polyprenyl-3-methyl-5-hydroxy-6-metoxy-1,4-benzoquinol methylase
MENSEPIENALKRLIEKLSGLNLKEIGISEYNQRYLEQYIKNFDFYAGLYRQLLMNAIRELNKPIDESVFIDYGGGCGFLSLLAKEAGFIEVIYCDIYDVSCDDARIIAENSGIKIDHFVLGNIDDLVSEIRLKQLYPDLICSFDVLEHIYKPIDFFKSLTQIKNHFSLVFMTSANPFNPIIRRRLMKMQNTAEYKGTSEYWGMKKRDIKIPFLQARKEIIKELLPDAEDGTLHMLAQQTRGLDKSDIREEIDGYKVTGRINYSINHPTNICDPYTGNWTENLIDVRALQKQIHLLNFHSEVSGGFYSFTENRSLNQLKSVLNFLIRRSGKLGLYLSATYTLKAKI